jgi:hypothetical protein
MKNNAWGTHGLGGGGGGEEGEGSEVSMLGIVLDWGEGGRGVITKQNKQTTFLTHCCWLCKVKIPKA